MRMTSQKVLGLLKRSLTPNRPYHAQWLLTRRCNYRCRSCSVWREPESKEELSFDEIKRGLDVLGKLGVVELVDGASDGVGLGVLEVHHPVDPLLDLVSVNLHDDLAGDFKIIGGAGGNH